jgi:NAD(P)H-hydrate epimerase
MQVFLTRSQAREIDRRSIEQYHIPGVVLMENAARAATQVAWNMLKDAANAEILILCGGGNNGGDGLAAARHLHNLGVRVSIALAADPGRYAGEALINWQIVSAMKLPVQAATPKLIKESGAALIADAIFGTGLAQPPRDPFGEIAAAVNESKKPVLAIDIPSGMDCDTGQPLGACIAAAQTITFVAQKAGFLLNPAARQYLGTVFVADIGCPRELIEEVAQPPNEFDA